MKILITCDTEQPKTRNWSANQIEPFLLRQGLVIAARIKAQKMHGRPLVFAFQRNANKEVIKKRLAGGWGVNRDSDIHELRRGDTDKVSSPPLGQAVIAVGLRFQVATLSGTGIIGSRLGATALLQCGPPMPLSDREVWLWDTARTHTHTHAHRVVCPGNLPGNHLSFFCRARAWALGMPRHFWGNGTKCRRRRAQKTCGCKRDENCKQLYNKYLNKWWR